jgi:murein DD-endopeptidase MepM/ murein hydrolase activator NlpD
VVGIVSNPVYKNAVIVSHGDYFTVYSKLETVNIRKGDEVKAKQVIGVVFTDNETRDSEVHFEVWKGSSKLNPSDWIAR